MFKPPISPQDVEQHALGDCYFLSSLSAIAENPHRLKRIFLNHELQPNGCYGVALCAMGVWEEIIIDDMFPCTKWKSPCFSENKEDEIWVLLAEKAFAKLSGGYANLISGLDTEALYMLTGAPTTIFRFAEGDPSSIFSVLLDAFENSFITTSSTPSRADLQKMTGMKGNDKEINGIVPAHNYSILGFVELVKQGNGFRFANVQESGQGHTVKLVKIRNPWGDTEWRGAW